MATTKKYLITHSENNTSVSPVGQILGASADNIKSGIRMMATEAIPSTSDILEFPNVGVTAAHLTEAQVKQLKSNKGILAVEEDVPMHILEMADKATEEAHKKAAVFSRQETEAYQRGYSEAMQSLMDSWNHMQGAQQNVSPYQQSGVSHGMSLSQLQSNPVIQPSPIFLTLSHFPFFSSPHPGTSVW